MRVFDEEVVSRFEGIPVPRHSADRVHHPRAAHGLVAIPRDGAHDGRPHAMVCHTPGRYALMAHPSPVAADFASPAQGWRNRAGWGRCNSPEESRHAGGLRHLKPAAPCAPVWHGSASARSLRQFVWKSRVRQDFRRMVGIVTLTNDGVKRFEHRTRILTGVRS